MCEDASPALLTELGPHEKIALFFPGFVELEAVRVVPKLLEHLDLLELLLAILQADVALLRLLDGVVQIVVLAGDLVDVGEGALANDPNLSKLVRVVIRGRVLRGGGRGFKKKQELGEQANRGEKRNRQREKKARTKMKVKTAK